MSKLSNCRSCGASIIWARHHASGKAAPIDSVPSPNGNIALDQHSDHYRILTGEDRATSTEPLHTNHFVTCPNAAKHKKAGGS